MLVLLILLAEPAMSLPMKFPSSSSLTDYRHSRHFFRTQISTPTAPTTSPPVPNNGQNSTQDALNYLYRFGYIERVSLRNSFNVSSSSAPLTSADPAAVRAAVVQFQDFAGLPPTGNLDKETLELMAQPRCGVADKGKTELRVKR